MARHPNYQPNHGNLPERRSIRKKGYNYSKEGFYFVTLLCYERRHFFGHIKNGIMCLNDFGAIVWEEWQKTAQIRPNIALGEFIVMPNHIHGIIQIEESVGQDQKERIGKFQSPSHTIGAIIRGCKGAVTRRIRAYIRQIEKEKTLQNEEPIKSDSETLSDIPTHISQVALDKSIWHRDYWDIIIRDQNAHETITNYIRNNPQKWSQDKFHSTLP